MIRRSTLVLLIALIFTACSNLKEVQVTGVEGFKLNRIDMTGIDGDIIIGIRNDNPFKFVIYPSKFDITYSGMYLGKASLAKKVKVKGKTSKGYSFNLKKDFKDISLPEIMKLLNGAAFKNSIEVKGDLKIGRFLVRRRIPIDVKEKVRMN